MVVSAFAIGALAYPVFYLGFIDTILTIFFINILGILPVCFFSTFGPKFGLRQMVLSRFFFGWYGVKVSKCAQHLLMGAILSKSHLRRESVCCRQLCCSDSWLIHDESSCEQFSWELVLSRIEDAHMSVDLAHFTKS
jgi:hypothetical protein